MSFDITWSQLTPSFGKKFKNWK